MVKPDTQYTDAELNAIRAEYAKGATDTQFTNFMRECRERDAVPGKHLYFQLRQAKEYDPILHATEWVKRAIHLTSIDFLRLVAQRTGEWQGIQKPEWIYLDDKGRPTIRSNNPEPNPWAAIVPVLRKGFKEPVAFPARFEACAVYYKNKESQWVLNEMWKKRGPEQLAKCSEAQNLRAAFPEELSGVYISEELDGNFEETGQSSGHFTDADAPIPLEPHTNRPEIEPAKQPAKTPEIDHSPAEGRDEPRPGEEKSKPSPMKKLRDRMRVYSREILPNKHGFKDPEAALKKFIFFVTGIEDVRTLKEAEFEKVLALLDEAALNGKLPELLTYQKENAAHG